MSDAEEEGGNGDGTNRWKVPELLAIGLSSCSVTICNTLRLLTENNMMQSLHIKAGALRVVIPELATCKRERCIPLWTAPPRSCATRSDPEIWVVPFKASTNDNSFATNGFAQVLPSFCLPSLTAPSSAASLSAWCGRRWPKPSPVDPGTMPPSGAEESQSARV